LKAVDSGAKRNGLGKADLHVFSKFFEDRLEGCLEAKALSRREIYRKDDVLDFLIRDFVDVEVTWQPAS
jgi:hypothetical protein